MSYETASNVGDLGTNAQVVVGLFKRAEDAHQAVTELKANGFSSQQIGAAFRDGDDRYAAKGQYLDATETSVVGREHESWWDKVKDAFRSEDSVEHSRERRAEAAEPAYSAGPADYDSTDYEYDWADDEFQGSLEGAGISSTRAAYLTRSLEPGGAIVTVQDVARAGEAEKILSANNGDVRYQDTAATDFVGTDVAATDAIRGTEYGDSGMVSDPRPVDASTTKRTLDASTSNVERMQLFGEVLRVHRERVSRGEARVRKEVITQNQTIEVPVTREELVLERVPVAGDTPANSADIGANKEIRIPLNEDRVRVEKEPVVREEVLVGKREVTDVQTVGDDVRHEELRVDSDATSSKRAVTSEDLPEDVRRHG